MVTGRVRAIAAWILFIVAFLCSVTLPAQGQLDVDPVTKSKETPPDEFVSLVFSIKNSSGSQQTVDFQLYLPDGWVAMDRPSDTVIQAGEKESIFITVQVPASTNAGTYPVKLSASYDTQEYSGEATVRVQGVKGVEIVSPDPKTVNSGTSFSYEFGLKNTGNITDTFYLEAESGHDWVTGLSSETIQIFPGSSKKFSVEINVPDGARAGRDPVTVTVTSARDKNVTASRTVFTTVLPPSPQAVGGEVYAILPASLEGNFGHNVGTGDSGGDLRLTAEGEVGVGNLYLDFGLSDLYVENGIDWNALDYSEEGFKVSSGDVGYTFGDLISLYGTGLSTRVNLGDFNLYLIDLADGILNGGGSLTYLKDSIYLATSLANLRNNGEFNLTESFLGRFTPSEESSLEIEAGYTPSGGNEGGAFRVYGEVGLKDMTIEGEAFNIGGLFAGRDSGEKGFRISQDSEGENYSEEFYYSYYYEPPEGVQTESSIRRSRLAATLNFNILGSGQESFNQSTTDRRLYFSGFAELVEAKDTGSNPTLDETSQKFRGALTYKYKNFEYFLEATEEIRTNLLSSQSFSHSSLSQGFSYTFKGISFFMGLSGGITENLTANDMISSSSSTEFRLETEDRPYVELSVKKDDESLDFRGQTIVNATKNLELSLSGNAATSENGFSFNSSINFTYNFDLPLKFLITRGRIDGYVFVDENGNGQKDNGEKGVGDVVLSVEDTRVASGENGYFKFPPFLPETYELNAQNIPGQYELKIDMPRQVEVEKGKDKTIGLPLVALGQVQVSVFEDNDRNGKRDEAEKGFAEIGLSLNGKEIDKKRFAGGNGQVSFLGLPPGGYTMSVDPDTLPPRSQITTGNQEISLDLAGGQIEKIEIGIYQEPRKIIFGQPPEADFLYAPLTPDTDTVVNFSGGLSTDPDGEITKYEWDFQGDGRIDKEGKIVSYNFAKAGPYEVTLTVKDDEGNDASIVKTIEVKDDGG